MAQGFKWTVIVASVILIILTTISIYGDYFSGWTFFSLLFYFVLFTGGIIYIKVGIQNSMDEQDELNRRKQRFDWCWERANTILKGMPGGQGLQWAAGVGRKSIYKSYYDGVQNKPFRSILAHLEFSQQLAMIIYNIDDDDIAVFVANPSPDLIENPFLNFKPFSRGQQSPFGDPRMMGRNTNNFNPRRVNISVGGDDFDQGFMPRKSVGPSTSTVDRAVDSLERS